MTQLTPFRARLADRLSGGMKQKLALACTLVHEPRVLLLDEPTTGVDPVSRREFWKLLSEFLSRGLTIVMATPYLDEAERCARVALLHEGRLLALDQPTRLQAALAGPAARGRRRRRETSPSLRSLRVARRRRPCSCSATARTSASPPARGPAVTRDIESALAAAGIGGVERPPDRRLARRRLHRSDYRTTAS